MPRGNGPGTCRHWCCPSVQAPSPKSGHCLFHAQAEVFGQMTFRQSAHKPRKSRHQSSDVPGTLQRVMRDRITHAAGHQSCERKGGPFRGWTEPFRHDAGRNSRRLRQCLGRQRLQNLPRPVRRTADPPAPPHRDAGLTAGNGTADTGTPAQARDGSPWVPRNQHPAAVSNPCEAASWAWPSSVSQSAKSRTMRRFMCWGGQTNQ